MTKCYQRSFEFPRVNRRIVEARFDGGDITSDGGVLLLRQADRLTGLSDSIARALSDPRRQASCDHDVPGLVRQRLYAIALGYEDLNDHDGLRQDVALQTAVERDQWLASASTLCRFENRADRETAWRLPASCFYESTGPKGSKTRHQCGIEEQALLLLGLWDYHRHLDLTTFTILTTEPGKHFRRFHHRVAAVAPDSETVDAYFGGNVDDAIELARGSNGDVLAVNPPEPVAA